MLLTNKQNQEGFNENVQMNEIFSTAGGCILNSLSTFSRT